MTGHDTAKMRQSQSSKLVTEEFRCDDAKPTEAVFTGVASSSLSRNKQRVPKNPETTTRTAASGYIHDTPRLLSPRHHPPNTRYTATPSLRSSTTLCPMANGYNCRNNLDPTPLPLGLLRLDSTGLDTPHPISRQFRRHRRSRRSRRFRPRRGGYSLSEGRGVVAGEVVRRYEI